jgi:uncharacterized protein with HEPN domain
MCPPEAPKLLERTLLALLDEAGSAVMILVEGLEESEFLRTRLTRQEAQRQLLLMAKMLDGIDNDTRMHMPEIDWAGWKAIAQRLQLTGSEADSALWFAVTALVPATMMWLRVYQNPAPRH